MSIIFSVVLSIKYFSESSSEFSSKSSSKFSNSSSLTSGSLSMSALNSCSASLASCCNRGFLIKESSSFCGSFGFGAPRAPVSPSGLKFPLFHQNLLCRIWIGLTPQTLSCI
ncbi:unnamed protein product [Moneuplotes crassus]|uniref:Uncharacterized protein n=1 Tax=Euplotes crassus TaxID=5936 RepID=A0AAD1XXM6_EUPCR|nr:unnamed protein product [Moneuplotes crassus]